MSLAELFAIVGYKVDESSIKRYDESLEKSKEKTKAVTEQTEGMLKRMQDLEAARNREALQVKEFIRLYDKLIEKKGKSQEEKKKDAVRAAEIVGFGPLKVETAEEKKKRAESDWKSTVTALNAGVELVGRGFDFARGKINGMLGDLAAAGGKAGDIADLSERTGIATDTLQELGYAAEQNGSDMASLANAWKGLGNKADSAVAGSKSLKKTFKEVGVSAKDLKSGKLSLDDAFGKIADKFKAMEDGPKKAALAMDLFGGAGGKLIPLLNQGGAGIKGFREEARKLGVVISSDGVKALDAFDDQSAKLKTTWGALRTQALAAIVPALSKVADKLQTWLGENREKAVAALTLAFNGLATVLSVVADGVGLAIEAFSFFSENRDLVVAALGGMTAALLAFKAEAIVTGIASALAAAPMIAAWALGAWPFVAIGLAVAALIKFFPQIASAAKAAAKAVAYVFMGAVDTVVGVFKLLWEGLKLLWAGIKAGAAAALVGLKAVIAFYVNTYIAIFKGIWTAVQWVWGKVRDGAVAVAVAIRDAFKEAFGWLIDKVEWLADKYRKIKKNLFAAPTKEEKTAVVDAAADSGFNYVAKRSAAASSSKSTTVNNENNFQISSNASDPKAVAKEVKTQMEGFWNGKMREAAG